MGYPSGMSTIRFLSLALAMLGLAGSAAAQEPAVMKKETATAVVAPITSMRHVGARTRPATPAAAQATPASARKRSTERAMRQLPIHFRR